MTAGQSEADCPLERSAQGPGHTAATLRQPPSAQGRPSGLQTVWPTLVSRDPPSLPDSCSWPTIHGARRPMWGVLRQELLGPGQGVPTRGAVTPGRQAARSRRRSADSQRPGAAAQEAGQHSPGHKQQQGRRQRGARWRLGGALRGCGCRSSARPFCTHFPSHFPVPSKGQAGRGQRWRRVTWLRGFCGDFRDELPKDCFQDPARWPFPAGLAAPPCAPRASCLPAAPVLRTLATPVGNDVLSTQLTLTSLGVHSWICV